MGGHRQRDLPAHRRTSRGQEAGRGAPARVRPRDLHLVDVRRVRPVHRGRDRVDLPRHQRARRDRTRRGRPAQLHRAGPVVLPRGHELPAGVPAGARRGDEAEGARAAARAAVLEPDPARRLRRGRRRTGRPGHRLPGRVPAPAHRPGRLRRDRVDRGRRAARCRRRHPHRPQPPVPARGEHLARARERGAGRAAVAQADRARDLPAPGVRRPVEASTWSPRST